jgi:phosphoglycolate phosphatase-like HAD superfamily hydrolase
MDNPLIIFDLDGTLLDIRQRFHRLHCDCMAELHGTPLSLEQYWQLKQSKTSEGDILKVSHNEDLLPVYEKMRKEQIESIDYLQYDDFWDGMTLYLHTLGEKFTLVIATLRNDPTTLEWQVEHLGLRDFFPVILFPDPADISPVRHETKVAMVKRHFGSQPLSGWFIGDTEVDILAGKALGLKTCAVAFGLRNAEVMSALEPDELARTPDELYALFDRLLAD